MALLVAALITAVMTTDTELRVMAEAYRDMAKKRQTEELDREDWLALMLDREAAMRTDRRLANRLRAAKLQSCVSRRPA